MTLPNTPATTVDVVVVGAGVVGLATARELLTRSPGRRVVVVDKADRVAAHQSSHNSGVVHAGLYYAPGSDKAHRCVHGKRLLEGFAAEHGIPLRHVGKLVVATKRSELPRLDELERRGRANGVPDLRRLDASAMREVEPHVTGLAALHSPRTAVTDFALVAEVLATLVGEAGGEVRLGCEVERVRQQGPTALVEVAGGPALRAHAVVVCAGLQADRLAGGPRRDRRIVPFRGRWWRLAAPHAARVNGNVYPVPDPRFPFLGVHATRRVDDEVWVGPNALLAVGREAYDGRPDRRDLADALGFAGLWRLGLHHPRAAVRELAQDRSRALTARALSRLLPGVGAADLEPAGVGIRAQLLTRDGRLVDDFVATREGNVVHLRNAPSPAATACLALAEELADLVAQQ